MTITETMTKTNYYRFRALAAVAVMALAAALMMVLTAKPAHASTTFTVNNTSDPGNGTCDAAGCTLREAINAANSTPGEDTIEFNITGALKTIRPQSELPTIVDTVTIDGYSQPGASPNTSTVDTNAVPVIELDGTNAGSGAKGLFIDAPNSVVRGLVINRFDRYGLLLLVGGSGTKIEGNFIGTGPSGQEDLGNGDDAVNITNASNVTVGGASPAARNLISGNDDDGIRIDQSGGTIGKQVKGNLIGTKNDGTSPLGNSGDGVQIFKSSSVSIGGEAFGEANTIAFNGRDGVVVDGETGTGNRVLSNSIFSNVDLGIDLGGDGPTANDRRDRDIGPNNFQNRPNIASATTSGGTTTVKGTLNSARRKSFTIQFFSNPTGTDEGKKLIGQETVKTNRKGKVSFTFSPAQPVPAGQAITATATDTSGNTSEFSGPKDVAVS